MYLPESQYIGSMRGCGRVMFSTHLPPGPQSIPSQGVGMSHSRPEYPGAHWHPSVLNKKSVGMFVNSHLCTDNVKTTATKVTDVRRMHFKIVNENKSK